MPNYYLLMANYYLLVAKVGPRENCLRFGYGFTLQMKNIESVKVTWKEGDTLKMKSGVGWLVGWNRQ